MKSIADHLRIIRRAAVFRDLKTLAWITYSTLLIIFMIALPVESVFYLSGFIRYSTWMFIGIGTFLFLGWLVLRGLQLLNNRVERYRWSTLARRAGKYAFAKEDTLINALQLERNSGDSTSADLSHTFVEEAAKKLEGMDLAALLPIGRTEKWKRITLTMLMITTLLTSFTWQHSASSLYRWAHPKTEFIPPLPFSLESATGHIHILGGETAPLVFQASGVVPDSITLELRSLAQDRGSLKYITLPRISEEGGYSYNLSEVYHDFVYRVFVSSKNFWQSWREISSPSYSISVTDRPIMENFTVSVIAPAYSRLPVQTQGANQADVRGLKGSTISITLSSNQELGKAELILNEKHRSMKVLRKKASIEFLLDEEGQFIIHLEDTRGISNRNPIPYHLQIIPDLPPEMSILQPPPIVELGGDQTIPIYMTIEDDFGFSNLQVAYEIRRPSYIQAEPFISMFSIHIEDMTLVKQEINTVWTLVELGLMPEDEVHYHFELYDNDSVSGPKKSLSGTFIARLPSLNDLFRAFSEQEKDIAEKVEMELEDVRRLKKQLEKAELDLLKTDKPNWDQQQALKKILEEVKEELERFHKLSEQLEALNKTGDKHELFSEDLLQKFNELQKLIEEIFPPEFLENMNSLEQALENLNNEDLLKALDNLAQNMDQIERELDRFLDIFRRVQAEQKMDELRKRLEQLVHQQDKLDQDIRQTDAQTDPSVFRRLGQEETMNLREYNDVVDDMEIAAEVVQEFSRRSARALEDLSASDLAEKTQSNLKDATAALNRQKSRPAMNSSYAGLQSLKDMEKAMESIQQQFQSETTQEMAQKFRTILRDVLTLSKSQEALRQETQSTPRNSPRQGDLAGRQQVLQDQLSQTMSNLMEMSKETFMVSPEMGRGMGMAYAQMDESKSKLGERNGIGSLTNQGRAMQALNEGARAILEAIKDMQASGSASGYAEFLKRMQEMAGQQLGINEQGMQLALGQMASSLQQALMQEMLKQQKGVRKSLAELMGEMNSAGKEGLGDMAGIAGEMDEVIKDIQARKYSRRTMERQQRILSRMLDSQRSMTQRGIEETRKSETGQQVVYQGPSGLPQDFGQRQSLMMEALNRAMKSGYSRDYQTMIRRYFNALIESEDLFIPDTTLVPDEESMNP